MPIKFITSTNIANSDSIHCMIGGGVGLEKNDSIPYQSHFKN